MTQIPDGYRNKIIMATATDLQNKSRSCRNSNIYETYERLKMTQILNWGQKTMYGPAKQNKNMQKSKCFGNLWTPKNDTNLKLVPGNNSQWLWPPTRKTNPTTEIQTSIRPKTQSVKRQRKKHCPWSLLPIHKTNQGYPEIEHLKMTQTQNLGQKQIYDGYGHRPTKRIQKMQGTLMCMKPMNL